MSLSPRNASRLGRSGLTLLDSDNCDRHVVLVPCDFLRKAVEHSFPIEAACFFGTFRFYSQRAVRPRAAIKEQHKLAHADLLFVPVSAAAPVRIIARDFRLQQSADCDEDGLFAVSGRG